MSKVTSSSGFRATTSVLRSVLSNSELRNTKETRRALMQQSERHDNGDRYLNRRELKEGLDDLCAEVHEVLQQGGW